MEQRAQMDVAMPVGPWCATGDEMTPAKDYAVLEYVRSTWDRNRRGLFSAKLTELWEGRARMCSGGPLPRLLSLYYVPGDYARAAQTTVKTNEALMAHVGEATKLTEDERGDG